MTLNVPPTTEFMPTDVSDPGLAELRRLALSAMKAAPRFGTWLHSWVDTEQARRAKGETTATARHACCLPLMEPWSDADVAGALEATAVLVHNLSDWTASQFAERLQLAACFEAGIRLRKQGTTDAN